MSCCRVCLGRDSPATTPRIPPLRRSQKRDKVVPASAVSFAAGRAAVHPRIQQVLTIFALHVRTASRFAAVTTQSNAKKLFKRRRFEIRLAE